MINFNLSVKSILQTKKIVVGILKQVFVRTVGILNVLLMIQ